MSRIGDLLREIEAGGLRGRDPTPEEWARLLAELDGARAEGESLVEATAASVGDVARLRHAYGRATTEVSDAIGLMTEAVQAFHESTRVTQDMASLNASRQQFTDWLGKSWFAQPVGPENTEDLDRIGAPLRTLHQRMRGLAWALGDLVEDAMLAGTTRIELVRAGTVQRGLVPPEHAAVPGLDLHSWFEPASHCAGDWWSAHALTEQDGLLIVGDVTGHGASSAIVTGAIKGACDVARMGMRGALRPPQLTRMLNRILREATRDEFMMTAVVLRVAAGGGIGAITNAGHGAPLLVHDGQVTTLQAVRDPPLGSTEAHNYSEMEFEAVPGDILVLYTDGVPETEGPSGSALGEKVIRQLAQDSAPHGSRAVRDAIRDAVLEHRGGRPAADDGCLVVATIT